MIKIGMWDVGGAIWDVGGAIWDVGFGIWDLGSGIYVSAKKQFKLLGIQNTESRSQESGVRSLYFAFSFSSFFVVLFKSSEYFLEPAYIPCGCWDSGIFSRS